MGIQTVSLDQIKNALAQYVRDKPTSDFDLNMELRPAQRELRDAAVLIPFIMRDGAYHLVLTKRSAQLKHHPGQIAFPGGKVDATDKDTLHAALREAHEEIGLAPEMVQIIGTLPTHETITDFKVTPIVGLITDDYQPVAEQGEVEEIFEVPLNLILDVENFTIQTRQWQGIARKYFTVPYGPYYIWGATARILRMLCDVLRGADETTH